MADVIQVPVRRIHMYLHTYVYRCSILLYPEQYVLPHKRWKLPLDDRIMTPLNMQDTAHREQKLPPFVRRESRRPVASATYIYNRHRLVINHSGKHETVSCFQSQTPAPCEIYCKPCAFENCITPSTRSQDVIIQRPSKRDRS